MTTQPSTGPRPRTEAGRQIDETVAKFREMEPLFRAYSEGRAAAFTAVEEAVRANRQPIDRSPVAYDVMTRRGAFDDVLAVLAKLQEDALHPADKEAETSHE